jgi:hypothetical protein
MAAASTFGDGTSQGLRRPSGVAQKKMMKDAVFFNLDCSAVLTAQGYNMRLDAASSQKLADLARELI